jgi:hypothetical protein
MESSSSTKFLVDGFPRKLDQLQEFEEKVRGREAPGAPRPGALLCGLQLLG